MTENGTTSTTDITEIITVPDRDLSASEVARIMRQVARVCGFVVGNIVRHSALMNQPGIAGAEHPIFQSIYACAAQAGTAAVNLEGGPKVLAGPQLVAGNRRPS
jgi:hypothetical protein